MALTKVTYSLINGAIFNVLDYGAVGNGIADDAVAINAAVTAAAVNGGIVFLPTGTYAVSAPILLKSNVTLQGEGAEATIVKQIGTVANWDSITTSSGVITTLVANEYENICVEGLKLQGLYVTPIPDGSANYAVNGISLANTWNSTVKDCTVVDSGTGIIIYGIVTGVVNYNNFIVDSTVRRAKSWIEAGNSGTPRGITIATAHSSIQNCVVDDSHTGFYVAVDYGNYVNCRASRWTDDGYYVNANNCTFTNCYAIGNTTRAGASGSGFAVNPSSGHIFTSCVAMRCPNAGVRFRHAGPLAPRYNKLIGCYFYDCGYGFLDDMTDADAYPDATAAFNVFVDNQAIQCQQSGFKFIRQQSSVINNNVAVNNNQAGVSIQTRGGISLDEYCLNNVVQGNVCYDTQGVPTQTFGLYNYPASVSGALAENTGNRFEHKSVNGVDLFYPQIEQGTANATIVNGTRSITGTVTFGLAFESTPVVTAALQNATTVADAERPITVNVYSVTATGFSFVVDAFTNVSAGRTVTVGWIASKASF